MNQKHVFALIFIVAVSLSWYAGFLTKTYQVEKGIVHRLNQQLLNANAGICFNTNKPQVTTDGYQWLNNGTVINWEQVDTWN